MSALERLVARYQRDLYKPEREQLRREELDAMQMYNEIARELAEKIRAETATLKAHGVLEPDKFRPCRDAADQIDPEKPDA